MNEIVSGMWSDFAYQGAGVLVTMVVIAIGVFNKPILKKFKKWVGRHQSLGDSLKDDVAVQGLLAELRVKLKADRATLCLFHNGGTFSSKKPQFRIACVNESLSHGIAGSFMSEQPVLASRMLSTIMPLFDEKFIAPGTTRISFTDKDDRPLYELRIELMEAGFDRTTAKNNAIHTSFIAGILDKYKQVVGFVRVDFCTFHREEGDPKWSLPLPCRCEPKATCLPNGTCFCMREMRLTAETIENISLKH